MRPWTICCSQTRGMEISTVLHPASKISVLAKYWCHLVVRKGHMVRSYVLGSVLTLPFWYVLSKSNETLSPW